ncbi:MAG TPA: hypothetical protein VNK26_00300, partial [Pyrinomonadaceae bacterium]|nr:hypothetical protein [Pyrinomonadaceae bacterium]
LCSLFWVLFDWPWFWEEFCSFAVLELAGCVPQFVAARREIAKIKEKQKFIETRPKFTIRVYYSFRAAANPD